MVLNGGVALTAYAGTENPSISLDIDGNDVAFSETSGQPFLDENQRTQVPFRIAMESYGCLVNWNEETQTATAQKDGITVEVPLGQKYIKKNGVEIITDTASLMKNDRVYLPIRAVAEAFGGEVRWNQGTGTVIIASPEGAGDFVTVHFIDVGHGDSIFIDYGEYEVLIDGGVTSSGAVISEYIKPYVDGDLELLIATHSHMDHVGGLPKIFEDYQVNRVIESGSSLDTPEWHAYEEALRAEPNCIITTDEDEIIQIAEGVELKIIEILDNQENENNNSVTALLTVGKVTVLLTADSQSEAEAVILQKVGKTDVFKGGHHGSFNANSKELLDVIKPQYTVISAGRGMNYNHPHAAALKRLIAAQTTLYGTFKSGTVVMKTNGNSYSFETADLGRILIPLQLSDAGTYQNNID